VTGPQGPEGLTGATGPQGDRGFVGASGTAIAYAVVLNAPPDEGGPAVWRIDDLSAKRLDNDVNFTAPTGTHGIYCLHDLPFTVNNAVATPGPFGGASHTPFLVQADVPSVGQPADAHCPHNTGVVIYATDMSGNLIDPPDSSDTIYFELN
jgi:hypothetical protein